MQFIASLDVCFAREIKQIMHNVKKMFISVNINSLKRINIMVIKS